MPANTQSIFEFVNAWNSADSFEAMVKREGTKPASLMARVRRLRTQGLPLKPLPGEGGALRKPKEKSNFVCHVQAMITYKDFGRLLAGAEALSADRLRAVIAAGLDAEEAERAEEAEEASQAPTQGAPAYEVPPKDPEAPKAAFDLFSELT